MSGEARQHLAAAGDLVPDGPMETAEAYEGLIAAGGARNGEHAISDKRVGPTVVGLLEALVHAQLAQAAETRALNETMGEIRDVLMDMRTSGDQVVDNVAAVVQAMGQANGLTGGL